MTITRRRILIAAGALTGLALAPCAGVSATGDEPVRWSGTALGAEATILMHGLNKDRAGELIVLARHEIERLEVIFSLYRPDSALVRLNRAGILDRPPDDLVTLLNDALHLARTTNGAFDPTVQPLWRLYAEHFAAPNPDPGGPAPELVAQARALVDFRAVEVAPERISLSRPGAALTLNGIAQGFATDRVADLFRREGVPNLLVDLGETRSWGRSPHERAWTVGIRDPRDTTGTIATVTLDDEAIATSGGYGTLFESSGRFHHLFDPATGRPANRYASVSVIAKRATLADGLSTACAALPRDEISKALGASGVREAILCAPDGTAERLLA